MKKRFPDFLVLGSWYYDQIFTCWFFLRVSHRNPWINKNAVYCLQISAFVLEIFKFEKCVKQPSHGKLKLANSCWQTHSSWCVWTAQKQAANTFANCWRQIETCLPTAFMPFTNEMTDDIMNSTQYKIKYINWDISVDLERKPLKLGRLIDL